MRMDLKVPCMHCPFSIAETRIRFACAERAEEIAESAYRNGFPCHKSAAFVEDEYGDGGFIAHAAGQHCIGSVMMFMNMDYGDGWPGVGNDDLPPTVVDRIWPNRHLAFQCEEDFIEANRSHLDDR